MAIEVFSDLSERLIYNLPGLPLYAERGELRQFEFACHWHLDLEFNLIIDGSMDYFVNGNMFRLNKDEGVFVNSKRLHYGVPVESSDCSFLCVVIHPEMLGANTHAGKAFIESKFSFDTEDYIVLTEQNAWQRELLTFVKRIYDEAGAGESNPLRLLSMSASLCAGIAEHIRVTSAHRDDEHLWLTIWKMTGYIYQNYDNKMTIEDIAASGSVCRSRCCRLFNEYVGQTPNAYLTKYRICKSSEMLRESAMSVCEISLACGFQSPSYFTQVFQKETGLTPRDYRKQAGT